MRIPLNDQSKIETPLFSILILCWNSDTYIRDCLRSLVHQTFKNFEVILVDNGSDEPILPEVWADFPNLLIRHEVLPENIGFAAGNNYAAKLARGNYLALLNSDAFPEPDWLSEICKGLSAHPNCSFASKLVMANTQDLLDGEGDTYHASGIAWRNSYGRSVKLSRKTETEVFSACGAAAVYPKASFEAVGGFDEDYFAYLEDIDLGFRLRLAGIPCIYLPSAVVNHIGSGSTSKGSDFAIYYGQRNLVWTFFKDMPGFLFFLLLPGHILMNLSWFLYSIAKGRGALIYRSKRDAVSSLGVVFRKRRETQRLKKTSLLSIARIIDWNPISPLMKLLRR
jgi:GT2 family glycosyltransferase